MSSKWNMKKGNGGNQKKGSNPTIDLLEIGLQSFSETLKVLDDALNISSGFKNNYNSCNVMSTCENSCNCDSCCSSESGMDIKLDARLGERRILSFLIENNTEIEDSINVVVSMLMDASGNNINPDGIITFQPASFSLPACKCRRVRMIVDIQSPLEEGQSYYMEIKIAGKCSSETICVGLCIQQEQYIDCHVLTDSCRPKKGKFITYENCAASCQSKDYYLCN